MRDNSGVGLEYPSRYFKDVRESQNWLHNGSVTEQSISVLTHKIVFTHRKPNRSGNDHAGKKYTIFGLIFSSR